MGKYRPGCFFLFCFLVYTGTSVLWFIYLFGVLHRFQHCTGHIKTGSWKGRGNQYIQFVRVLYCKLPTNGKQLPAFPLEAVPGTEPRPQRWEARVLPLCHRDPLPGTMDHECEQFSFFNNISESMHLTNMYNISPERYCYSTSAHVCCIKIYAEMTDILLVKD